MKSNKIKELILKASVANADENQRENLAEAGIDFRFSNDFTSLVLDKIFNKTSVVRQEVEFTRSFNLAFYRIALTGVAAIVILLISIFLNEGTISFNSFVGLGNGFDEGIVYLLTGN
ncbi:MAG: hypothetical protein U0X39_14330 [Bacteroidales bacterium]